MIAFRGALIFPKLVDIGRLDTQAIAAAGDYDRIMGEVRASNPNRTDAPRDMPRPETVVRLNAQIETSSFERMVMTGTGNAGDSFMVLVLLAEELEENGLLDPATKKPLFKPDDRLIAIYDQDERLILSIEDPPGLYATHVQPIGFGFGFGGYNLVEATFAGRPSGTSGGGAPGS